MALLTRGPHANPGDKPASFGEEAARLPNEPTQARRFGKARRAQSHALLEDYVELIADLLAAGGEARPTDIARRLGVSHATAIKTIGRLKREGLAVAKPYRGVFLTDTGERLAERVRTRHRTRGRSARGGGRAGRGGRTGCGRDRTPRIRHDAPSLRAFSAQITGWTDLGIPLRATSAITAVPGSRARRRAARQVMQAQLWVRRTMRACQQSAADAERAQRRQREGYSVRNGHACDQQHGHETDNNTVPDPGVEAAFACRSLPARKTSG